MTRNASEQGAGFGELATLAGLGGFVGLAPHLGPGAPTPEAGVAAAVLLLATGGPLVAAADAAFVQAVDFPRSLWPGRRATSFAAAGLLGSILAGGLAGGLAGIGLAAIVLTLLASGARALSAGLRALGAPEGAALAGGALPALLLIFAPVLAAPLFGPGPAPTSHLLAVSPLAVIPHAVAGFDILKLEPLYRYATYAQAGAYGMPGPAGSALRLLLVYGLPLALLSGLASARARTRKSAKAAPVKPEKVPEAH